MAKSWVVSLPQQSVHAAYGARKCSKIGIKWISPSKLRKHPQHSDV